jgi:hypothetical protein
MLRIILAAVAAALFTFSAHAGGLLDNVTVLKSKTVTIDPTHTSAYGVEQYNATVQTDREKRLNRFARIIGESADELVRSAVVCHSVNDGITAVFSKNDPARAWSRFDQYNATANAMGVSAEVKLQGLVARGTIPAQCIALVGLIDGTYELLLRTGTQDFVLTSKPAQGPVNDDSFLGTIPSWTNLQALGQVDRYAWVMKNGVRFPILHGAVDEVVNVDPVLPTDQAPIPMARPGS